MAEEPQMTEPFRCGHCSNVAPMEIRCADTVHRLVERGSVGEPYESADTTEVLRCSVCGKSTVRSYFWGDWMELAEVEFHVLYPSNRTVPAGLPMRIEQEFADGQKVKLINADLFGIQMRRILEMVCEDRLGTDAKAKDDLQTRLKALAAKGEIPKEIVEVADHARLFGNIGAHPVMGSGIKPEAVPVVEKLCVAALEYVYSLPKLVEDARQMLETLRQARTKRDPSAPP